MHCHSLDFSYHAFPIDCYIFFGDVLIAMAELTNLEIADIIWSPTRCFVAYRKGKGADES